MEIPMPMVWRQVDELLPLEEGEVQVWKLRAEGEALIGRCRGLLSKEELERMERLREGVARDEFVVGRACLRMLLGSVLGKRASEISLEAGVHGKPQVAGVQFNVAHSHGFVLIALCKDFAVGVDVEWINPSIEALEIAEDSFAAGELECIRKAKTTEERALVFGTIWARKEAVVKAHGEGLGVPLDSFDVSRELREPVRLGHHHAGTEDLYFLHDLRGMQDFTAALAIHRGDLRVTLLAMSSGLLLELL